MVAPVLPPNKTLVGGDLGDWILEVQARLSALELPGSPTPLFTCTKANLPAASSFVNCAAFISDVGVVGLSNGVNWVNAGTGAIIA